MKSFKSENQVVVRVEKDLYNFSMIYETYLYTVGIRGNSANKYNQREWAKCVR